MSADKSKQPPECESIFKPFSEERPKNIWDSPNAVGYWTKCPHIKMSHQGFDSESYDCDVCGERYTLYYEDMA